MSNVNAGRRRRTATLLLAVLFVIPALERARCSGISMRATRFVEAYQSAPDIGIIGRVALSLRESDPAERNHNGSS